MNYLAISLQDKEHPAPKQWWVTIGMSLLLLTLWTISLLTFGFSLAFYLPTMLIVGVLIFLTPTAGLPIIILATMWFQRWFTLEPIIIGDLALKLYPIDIVLIITLLSFAFHQAFGHQKWSFPKSKESNILLIFFLLCVAYLVRGYATSTADFALVISAFKNYAFYGLLYFLVLFSIRELEDVRLMLKVFLAGGLGLLVFVAIGLLRGEGLWVEYNVLSTEGVRFLSFPHAFYLSLVLAMLLVFMVYRIVPEKRTLLIMWGQLVGVLGSLMRHLWISLVFVAVFLFLTMPKYAKRQLAGFFSKNAAVVALVASFLLFLLLLFPFSSFSFQLREFSNPFYFRARSLVQSTYDSSARWRIFAWRAAQESFLEQPIIGVGYGQDLVIDFETYQVTVETRDLHNSYLVLLVQMGIVGFVVFLSFLFLILKEFYQSWKGKGIYWPYQAAVFSSLFVWLTAAFWQPYFETNFTGIFFWILAGLLVVTLRLDESEAA